MNERVLVIDDDTELVELVADYLKQEGFTVEAAFNGEAGVERALNGDFTLVILDVMLTGINGFEVLRRVRAASRVPIIMLTARDDELDRVMGLEGGADDYLPKPFSPREMVARIRAVLRRTHAAPPVAARPKAPLLCEGDLQMDVEGRVVTCAGQALELTGVEFDLLHILLRDAGRVVARDTITRQVFEREPLPFDRSLDTHISNLRRKIGPLPGGSERIKTMRGAGYIYKRAGAG